MFKLFQNLLTGEANKELDSTPSAVEMTAWEKQIAHADTLWEQGKLSEALAIYGLAIENNPNLPEIQQRLAERLKQQGDIAVAYEKLAIGLRNQGNVEQAASYYRQAINLKALTGNTKDQLLKSSISPLKRPPIPIASLKEAAFSFQPLPSNLAIVKVASSDFSSFNREDKFRSSPGFNPRLKAVNPQQARDIDWETAQVYFQKALEHLEREEWQQSALACKQATQIMPNMAEAYKIWGNALQRMGQTGEAMSCYAKAVEVKPNLAEVYAGIADIYRQQEQWQQAIKHYQKAIIIKPSAPIHRQLALVWQRLGEAEKAEFNLYQAQELELSETSSATAAIDLELDTIDPANVEDSVATYCRVARQLEQKGRWQQAAKYYRQALDLSMSRPALMPQEQDSAEPVTADMTQSHPTDNQSQPSELAANIDSQLDKAIKRYHRQTKLQPNSPKIHTDLGNLYAKKGKLQYAIACYRQAIKLNRKYPKAHLSLARVLLKIGKQQEFVKEMQLALALQPKIGTALDRFYLGNALVDRDQQQQAIGFYYKAIVLNPKFSQSYHRLSDVLSKQGKHQEAIEFLEQGICQNPQNPESHYLLAQQWENLQNWENAVKTYSHVLQLEPQFPEASQKLNHALAQKLKSKNRYSKSESTRS
ncbi:MAG: tetratricopeptide repeat protein [Cyanobacteria bacterium P01_E01_bin.35]